MKNYLTRALYTMTRCNKVEIRDEHWESFWGAHMALIPIDGMIVLEHNPCM